MFHYSNRCKPFLNKKLIFFWLIVIWLNSPHLFLMIHLNQITFSLNPNYNLNLQTNQAPFKVADISQFQVSDLISVNRSFIDQDLSGENSTIAIIDTGIYPYHEVFTNNGTQSWNEKIIAFYDAFTQIEKSPEDIDSHGTYVSSIAVGNSPQYLGVAPDAKLVSIKVFEYSEEEDELISSIQTIENGINWVLENKNKYNIKIVSMSFGVEASSDSDSIILLNSITESLVEAGIVVVAAVGNDGGEGTGFQTINSPADAKSVIGVGGVKNNGMMYSKSSKGPSSENIIKPDLCAPAVGIYGATKDHLGRNNTYMYASGTSAAAPMVSGLASLMLEKDFSLTPLEVKSIISLTSLKTIYPRVIKDNYQGWGMVQGYAALDALDQYVSFENNNSVCFSLGDNSNQKKVWCRKINLQGGMHYFFDLALLNDAEAELYIFDTTPNYYGEPIITASTINQFDFYRRCGIFVPSNHDYFLVVKLIFGSGSGNFLLSIIFDYRLLIIVAISALMIIGIIYLHRDLNKSVIEIKKI